MKKEYCVPCCFSVGSEEKKEIKKAADQEGKTFSEFVRDAIRMHLDKEEEK